MAEIPRVKPLARFTHEHLNRLVVDLNNVLARLGTRVGAIDTTNFVTSDELRSRVQGIVDQSLAIQTSDVSDSTGAGNADGTSGAGGAASGSGDEDAAAAIDAAVPTTPPPNIDVHSAVGTTTEPVQFALADHTHGGAPAGLRSANTLRAMPHGESTAKHPVQGTYGSSGQVAQLTVDRLGRVTAVTNVGIVASTSDLLGRLHLAIAPQGDHSTIQPVQGTFGSSSLIPVITLDRRGRIESVTNVAITATNTDNMLRHALGLAPKGDWTSKQPVQGTYGSATQVAQIVVDRRGRVTSAANVNITAGNDLAIRRDFLTMGG